MRGGRERNGHSDSVPPGSTTPATADMIHTRPWSVDDHVARAQGGDAEPRQPTRRGGGSSWGNACSSGLEGFGGGAVLPGPHVEPSLVVSPSVGRKVSLNEDLAVAKGHPIVVATCSTEACVVTRISAVRSRVRGSCGWRRGDRRFGLQSERHRVGPMPTLNREAPQAAPRRVDERGS